MRGNITRRGKASWQIKFDVGTVNGKRQTRYATVRGTYKDAQKELTRLLGAADGGTLPDPTRMTVAEYIPAWLDSVYGLSPRTIERYRELAEWQIIPHLGAAPLQKLTPEQVQAWHGTLLKTLSPRTVLHAHRVLNLALKCAVRNSTLTRNVAAVHKPPAVEQKEIEIISSEQIADVLHKLDGHMFYPIAALALATEQVHRSVEETRAGLRVKPPKTKRGRRSITLPPETVVMCFAHTRSNS